MIERNVPYSDLEEARNASERLIDNCISKNYPFCRSDSRLSDNFVEKIDHIFHPDIFEPELFRVVMDSKILEYSKELLSEDDIYMTFNRIHTTRKYSTWSAWHRDDSPTREHIAVKATLPLFNEVGFAVLPGSHKKNDQSIEGFDTNSRSSKENQVQLPIKAGDLLLFDTGIVHRGSCAGRKKYRRAHIHFQFTPTKYSKQVLKTWDNWLDREELLDMANESWKKILTKKIEINEFYKTTQRTPPTSTLLGKTTQSLKKFSYYMSSLLPQNSRLIQEPNPNFVPYVKVPKKYQHYFD